MNWKLKIGSLCLLLMTTSCSTIRQLQDFSCEASANYMGPKTVHISEIEHLTPASINFSRNMPSNTSKILEGMFYELFHKTKATAASVSIYSERLGYWQSKIGLSKNGSDAFWLASISKLTVASIIIQMIEEKKLSLDDTLDKWFPKLPNSALISIEHLLLHKSGLSNFNQNPIWREQTNYKNLEFLLKQSANSEALFCPGTTWDYSNTGYAVLGAIAETIDGKPLAEILHKRISSPLKLTSLKIITPNTNKNSIVASVSNSPDFMSEIASIHGAGAIAGNARDMLSLLEAYLSGDIISKENLELSHSTLYPLFSQNVSYGRGVMVTQVPDPKVPAIWRDDF